MKNSRWVNIYTNKNNLQYVRSWNDLSGNTYGYKVGDQVQARLQQRMSGYSDSGYYYMTTGSDILKQPPAKMGDPVTWANQTMIIVSWTALTAVADTGNDDQIYYKLMSRKGYTSTLYEKTTPGVYGQTQFTDTLPSPNWLYGSPYDFQMIAVNQCGEGTKSGLPFYYIPVGYPNFMNAPYSSTITSSQIRMSWIAITSNSDTGGDTIRGYELSYSEEGLNSYSVIYNSSSTSYTQTNPYSTTSGWKWNTNYQYRLRARNDQGWSPYSTSTTITTAINVPLQMPAPYLISLNSTQITLGWIQFVSNNDTGGSDITHYQLQYKTASGGSWLTLNGFSGYTQLSFQQTSGFVFSTQYVYQIKAVNAAGSSPWSAYLTILTSVLPKKMATPFSMQITPTIIETGWIQLITADETGNDTITDYQLDWADGTALVYNRVLPDPNTGNFLTQLLNSGIFPPNNRYLYRVRAKNAVGQGPVSDSLEIWTDNYPQGMTTISNLTVTPTSVTLTWPDLIDFQLTGRDPIIFYQVEHYSGSQWIVLNDESEGHYITYTHESPTVFPSGSTQKYRVKPRNGVGLGTTYSNELSVRADGEPTAMNTPIIGDVTPKSIKIQWNELTDETMNGGDLPLYYKVEWYSYITLEWEEVSSILDGMQLVFTHTRTEIIPSSSIQQYRILPLNGVGWGTQYSAILYVTADQEPIYMPPPTLFECSPSKIIIIWQYLTNDAFRGRDPVIFYHVMWHNGDNNWAYLTIETDPPVNQNYYVHTLPSGEIFVPDTYVFYKVCPINGVGLGACSVPLSVLTDKAPISMTAPFIQSSSIHPQWILVEWNPLLDPLYNGRDVPIYYQVEWDMGTNMNLWTILTTLTTSADLSFNHTSSNVFPADSYFFYRVSAMNGVGLGPPSVATSVLTDRTPTFMFPPFNTSVTASSIVVEWMPITTDLHMGRDLPVYYSLEYYERGCYASDASICTSNTYTDGTWVELTQFERDGLITQFTHTSSNHFHAATEYNYRVRAKNGVGFGEYSSITSFLTDDFPKAMTAPLLTSSVKYNQIKVYWASMTDYQTTGRDPIIYYSLWWDQSIGSWEEISSFAVNGLTLTFTHTSATRFPENADVYYKLKAQNGVGLGPFSPTLLVLTPMKPTFMNQPTNTSVAAKQIVITWNALTDNTQMGRDTILYYSLEWDQGTNTWVEITSKSDGLVTTFTQTSSTPFPNSTLLSYRLRAENGMGIGPYSATLTFVSDRTPLQVSKPVATSVTYNSVSLSWTALTTFEDTGRDPITYYMVEYHDNSGTGAWTEISTSANGVKTSLTHSNTFPAANVDRSDQFVRYRVTAQNGVGFGIISAGLYVLTCTYPKQMTAPVLNVDPAPQSIIFQWTALTFGNDTGRDSIIYYQLMWTEVGGSGTWTELTTPSVLVTTKTVTTGFKINTNYDVKVAAKNHIGLGAYSPILTILTDDIPQKVNTPVEDPSTNANYVKITWTPITDPVDTGRDDIIYYKVEWNQGPSFDTWVEISSISNGLRTYFEQSSNIQNGTSYKYRITPQNRAGFGPTSPDITVIPSSPPAKMSPLFTSIIGVQVKIEWTSPIDNGDSLDAYQILIQAKDGTFYETLNCDGADPTIFSQQFCIVDMSELRDVPYSLQKTDPIIAVAKASNIKGFSPLNSDSPAVCVVVETEPDPIPPASRGSLTTYQFMEITWLAIADASLAAGGVTTSILSYNLYINQGNVSDPSLDVWTDFGGFVPLSLATSFTKSSSIIPGTTYKAKLRALNKYGWGPFGTPAGIRCASPPEPPTSLATASKGTQIEMSWAGEGYNGGLDVIGYKIEFQRRGFANMWSESTECNGMLPGVFASRKCQILMTSLKSDYGYLLDDFINVRVAAVNLEGAGSPLVVTDNQAKVQTEPSEPNTYIVNDMSVTTDKRIKISWNALSTISAKGGIEISAYEIYWAEQSSLTFELLYTDEFPFSFTYTYMKINPSDTSSTASAIIGGATYKLKYRAVNIHGAGLYSPITTLIASAVPYQLSPIVTTLSGTVVKVQWDPSPDIYSLPVTIYRVKFKKSDGTFIEDSTICAGNTLPVLTDRTCLIQMSKFTNAATFNLQIDDLIVVTIEAYNKVGWSIVSTPNTIGVTVKAPPQVAVTNLARGSQSGKVQIHITWTGLTQNYETGASPIDYRIYFDKGTNQQTWTIWAASTLNSSSYMDTGFKTGTLYYFKVLPFNDFGPGLYNSTAFGIWAGSMPLGLNEPSTTLNRQTYVDEDDIVIIDWEPPLDDGGLPLTYVLEIMQMPDLWRTVVRSSECNEQISISNYQLPLFTALAATTQCTMLVSNLKQLYGLTAGNLVVARVSACQPIGCVQTSLNGNGQAILPNPPCLRTTFPRSLGGEHGPTHISSMDIDERGNIAFGGSSQDTGLLDRASVSQPFPIAGYIAKGNLYLWVKQIETNDQGLIGAIIFQRVLDVTFRYDGERIAIAMERTTYDISLVIIIINKDGSLFGSFRESTNVAQAKINIGGIIFDSTNFLTIAMDYSYDGTDQKRQAVLTRFSVNSPIATSIPNIFYLKGGATNKISQIFLLQRIKNDLTSLYMSALLTDVSDSRKSFLVKLSSATGALQRFFYYQPSSQATDFTTASTIPSIRKLSLFENELTGQHVLGACIISQDGSKLVFGTFILLNATQSFQVLMPSNGGATKYACQGIYQNTISIAYTLISDMSSALQSEYKLYFGKISYLLTRLDLIDVVNHDGYNNYGGARFINGFRFYYWGQTLKMHFSQTQTSYSEYQGFISLFDQYEHPYSCLPDSQIYSFLGAASLNLVIPTTQNMQWQTTGVTNTNWGFAGVPNRPFKTLTLQPLSLRDLNLLEPFSTNTNCPAVLNDLTMTGPSLPKQFLNFKPDPVEQVLQEVAFTPFLPTKTCEDTVIFYSAYIVPQNVQLPSFITLDTVQSKYQFSVTSTSHVGTYSMVLHATLGNNQSATLNYDVEISSPCKDVVVTVNQPQESLIWDISDKLALLVPLDWTVTSPPQYCDPSYFVFTLVNATTGDYADFSVFSVVSLSGIQYIKVWSRNPSKAKIWPDLKVVSQLQGDLVQNFTYSVTINNRCLLTTIIPTLIEDQVYYIGRDPNYIIFDWLDTIGTCGPMIYTVHGYNSSTPEKNYTIDSTVFTFYSANSTLKIYNADERIKGTFYVRVYASLGMGGFQQSTINFQLQVIRDPCTYYQFETRPINDLTLWIDQPNQIVNIPPFVMIDPLWVCNFTYELKNSQGSNLDSMFLKTEIVSQGFGPSVQLVTQNVTKWELSPYGIRVRGWPSRQGIIASQQYTFRVFIAIFNKTDCQSGTYYDSKTDKCESCSQECLNCVESATKCTWCSSGKILIEDGVSYTCIEEGTNCPGGTVKDSFLQVCRKCPEFCQECSDYNTCTKCISRYSLTNNQCSPPQTCPAGYRFINFVQGCIACPSNCDSCESSTVCTYCSPNYYLDSLTSQCTQTCPDGYFGDKISRMCMICQPACRTCHTNNYTCTSCQDYQGEAYYHFAEAEACVQRCPYVGYFQNVANHSCDACDPACQICIGAIDDCNSCNQGFVISDRKCMNSCPDMKFITPYSTCFPCDKACFKCFGGTSSMCSICNPNYYLTGKTCDTTCDPPTYPDKETLTCMKCAYFCNECTAKDNCRKCKTGYKQELTTCSGENFLRLNSSNNPISLPIDHAKMGPDFNPTEVTVEIWFKAVDVYTKTIDLVVGLSPYKIRKKQSNPQVSLNFETFNFCDSIVLSSDQWFHYSFTISEISLSLNCYLNGIKLGTGIVPVVTIATDVIKFREITLGGSLEQRTSESKFNGYVKEFRWWKAVRTEFQIKNFMSIGFSKIPAQLVAYWRLDEKSTDASFKDSASSSAIFTPSSELYPPMTQLVEMKEIYLKFCPEGNFVQFNYTLGYYVCMPCNPACKNCNSNTSSSCTECNYPYRLLQQNQTCINSEKCPEGYYEDTFLECQPCHEFCQACEGTPFQCPKCKSKYFKTSKGQGCTDRCPLGSYGNHLTQLCSPNPIVTTIKPDDTSIIPYGDFVEISAAFILKNNEPAYTYTYGWKITKLKDDLDLAQDAAKSYYQTQMSRAHLDLNIIEPNHYYNITFYVKGNEQYYSGLLGYLFNIVYIGTPPRGGKCIVTPAIGTAGVTPFTIQTSNWNDKIDQIGVYSFFYSLDNGDTYYPIPTLSIRQTKVVYIFNPVYSTYKALIQCHIKTIIGFKSFVNAPITLEKRAIANAKVELDKFSLVNIESDLDTVEKASQLDLIARKIGNLNEEVSDFFNPLIELEQCNDRLCSFGGTCKYDTFKKYYFCECSGTRAGRNCSFTNSTQLEMIQNYSRQIGSIYKAASLRGYREYDLQLLKTVTSQIDLMSDDLFDSIFELIDYQVNNLQLRGKQLDSTQQEYFKTLFAIVSNMLSHLDYNYNKNRFFNLTAPPLYDFNLNRTINLVAVLRGKTLQYLNPLQTEIQVQSYLVSYRQVISNKETTFPIPATSQINRKKATFVKISPSNFKNNQILSGYDYVAEVIEYAINPFKDKMQGIQIASNVFEFNLFDIKDKNSSIGPTYTQVKVQNLSSMIEFFFPISKNKNLTDFVKIYNSYSPYKFSEKAKRELMLKASGLKCVHWDHIAAIWSDSGCNFSSIDQTHVRCSCNHLTAFALNFSTPVIHDTTPVLENTTVTAAKLSLPALKVSDLVRWPLSAYFANLKEVWQHHRPSFVLFIVKPGFYLLLLFWVLYFSSLVYYAGEDDHRRMRMTKAQNRDDLAEIKNNNVQKVYEVVKELIVSDFIRENGKYIRKEAKKKNFLDMFGSGLIHKMRGGAHEPPKIKIYDMLNEEEQKLYRKRARKKVFGVPGGMVERAHRFFDKVVQFNKENPNEKIDFVNEELKNNLWIGLIAKSSKIAPRHVRQVLMYFYTSLYILEMTIIYAFQLQEVLHTKVEWQILGVSFLLIPSVWIITIPVAFIFRMPMSYRMMLQGVKTTKINKVFKELDALMGLRYAFGYFICLTGFILMSVCTLVFTIFYPQPYVMGWALNIVVLFLLDQIGLTIAIAFLQFFNAEIARRYWPRWKSVWVAIEVFRYAKNLRG